jgi:hypothetical protein
MKSKLLIKSFLTQAEEHRFTDKERRQHEHIKRSEEEAGKSPAEADKIGWATVNKEKSANLIKDFLNKKATENAPEDSPECGAVCQMRHNGMTEEEAMAHWNKEHKATVLIQQFLYKEAYGVTPGGSGMSGGNYSMGPKIDTTPSMSVSAPTDENHAFDPSIVRKTKKEKIVTQPRYTGTEQRVQKQPNSNVKKKVSYDKTPLSQEVSPGKTRLEELYPSLFQEKQTKKPSMLQNFTDWLKGKHQKYFGAPMGEPQMGMEASQVKEVISLVKTAVADSNGKDFDLILSALQKMKISEKEILVAFKNIV